MKFKIFDDSYDHEAYEKDQEKELQVFCDDLFKKDKLQILWASGVCFSAIAIRGITMLYEYLNAMPESPCIPAIHTLGLIAGLSGIYALSKAKILSDKYENIQKSSEEIDETKFTLSR